MGEHRTGYHCRLMTKPVDEYRKVGLGMEAQAVHTGVEFDMHRIVGNTFTLGRTDERLQQSETVDLRLQCVSEHGAKCRGLRIHDDDITRNAGLAQLYSLIGHGHGQEVDTPVLQGLGYFNSTRAIGRSLDHAHHLGLGFHERTIEIQIFSNSFQVHLERGFMHTPRHSFAHLLKVERSCPFEQYHTALQSIEQTTRQQAFAIREEMARHCEIGLRSRNLPAHTYQQVHTTPTHHLGHASIELLKRESTLQNVAQHEHLPTTCGLRPASHKVECNVQ